MKKKIFSILGVSGCLILASYLYCSKPLAESCVESSSCAFCDSSIVNRQKFYEDELVLALYTHKPILPGHCLIIPKRHVQRFELLSEEEITRMGQVIQKVDQAASKQFNTTSYLLLQKNGVEVGQTVPHVHFHYVPRQEGDASSVKFLMKMYLANWLSPLSRIEMQNKVSQMQEQMQFLEGPKPALIH